MAIPGKSVGVFFVCLPLCRPARASGRISECGWAGRACAIWAGVSWWPTLTGKSLPCGFVRSGSLEHREIWGAREPKQGEDIHIARKCKQPLEAQTRLQPSPWQGHGGSAARPLEPGLRADRTRPELPPAPRRHRQLPDQCLGKLSLFTSVGVTLTTNRSLPERAMSEGGR